MNSINFKLNINWRTSDGTAMIMINDFARNQFYDKILKRYVKDQVCTDIGFGTGLLTMLALKHGAQHVRAFELDPNRYLLGQEIIKRLDLKDKISLFNERYTNTIEPTPVTFTETVNKQLWQEGIWHSLPNTSSKTKFLPGKYFLELWAVEISQKIGNELCFGSQLGYFDPGVELPTEYVQLINNLAGTSGTTNIQLVDGINEIDYTLKLIWNQLPQIRKAMINGSIVSKYEVSYHDNSIEQFSLIVNLTDCVNKTVLLIPRSGMQQDDNKLYLDSGHWNPVQWPVVMHNFSGMLTVNHRISDGKILYEVS